MHDVFDSIVSEIELLTNRDCPGNHQGLDDYNSSAVWCSALP